MTTNTARGLFCVCLLISVAFAARACTGQEATPSGLTVSWEDRFLEVHGEEIPGGPIRTHYLEAYCRPGSTDRDWHETVIQHDSRLLSATEDGKRLIIEDRLADGVVVRHEIVAGVDDVTFKVTATNPTDSVSQVHWAQPCMRVDGFTGADPAAARELQPPYIRKCFLMIDGKLTRLPTQPWASEARYTPGQVYAPIGVDRDDVNPRPLSKLVPSSGLTGCFSADEKMILAVAWEPTQEIFQGVITCMHNDFRIGGLKPGETKEIRGKLYIVSADESALLKRFRRDFPPRQLDDIPRDLTPPPAEDNPPAPGRRVFQSNEGFENTSIRHTLYLPTNWQPGRSYPVIMEYPGNRYRKRNGSVESCTLGYGVSGGADVIWVGLPFVDSEAGRHAVQWWGDVDATVAYCKQTVARVCKEFGGDADNVFLAGFSRGAIACNYIGLHDDAIAKLWRGFICHSHYDGVRSWPYEGSDRDAAAGRLARLGNRPQFIGHEMSIKPAQDYLRHAHPKGNFTFYAIPYPQHTDEWCLRDTPAREALRNWFADQIAQ